MSDVGGAGVEAKSFVRSKTIWGAVMAVLPHLLGAFGVAFETTELQDLATTGSAFLGALLVAWGRATASRPIALRSEVGARNNAGGRE